MVTLNYNGQSEPSDTVTLNCCDSPFGLDVPFRIFEGSSANNINIGWLSPLENGGCPITGYSIYRDDANGSAVDIETNVEISGDPTRRSITMTEFEADSTGKTFRVKVRAHNREGFIDSPYLSVINMGFPKDVELPVQLLSKDDSSMSIKMPIV